ncbi:hypothetical protein DN752_00860 [Echinicola strongylocentroti]|uniref:Uncharacterized protein n=1 Tax=Echinicola strongylocentroti TaxID=1795355 RepID=A0A2Z4IDU4_9BACT|nr:hypothetical protein [Echinicola strongylocentroti]AWW28796.1 hypothetical protein DN752_00860 [Echinicola strongylocentroti]
MGRDEAVIRIDFDHYSVNDSGDLLLANDPASWKVEEGKLACMVSNKNQYLMLKNDSIARDKGTLSIRTRLGFYNDHVETRGVNWVGFCIGCNRIGDSPANPIGLKAGIGTNGSLFIGDPNIGHIDNPLGKALDGELELEMEISSKSSHNAINLKVLQAGTGNVLAHISKKKISSKTLKGMVGLVSDFKSSEERANKKSAYFTYWEISRGNLNKN